MVSVSPNQPVLVSTWCIAWPDRICCTVDLRYSMVVYPLISRGPLHHIINRKYKLYQNRTRDHNNNPTLWFLSFKCSRHLKRVRLNLQASIAWDFFVELIDVDASMHSIFFFYKYFSCTLPDHFFKSRDFPRWATASDPDCAGLVV